MPADIERNGAVWVSADALSGCVEAGQDAGFDVRPYLARHGIDCEMIENSRGLISYHAMNDCLEDIAHTEKCQDFGFRLAKWQKPLQFGLISQVLQFATTIGEAIRIFLKYRDLYSQSSHWDLRIEDGVAQLRRFEVSAKPPNGGQVLIYSLTRGFEALKSMIGVDWAPIGLYFSADGIAVSAVMRQYFGAPIFFSSQYDEIAFPASDLVRPIPTGNPELLAALTGYFDRLLPELSRRGPVATQVQKQLRVRIGNEACTLDAIAESFGMHPRTLQRALATEGTSFRHVERETRMQIAEQLVETTRMPFSNIATMAGYEHLSSFSRAFHKSNGSSARMARRKMTNSISS